MKQYDREILSVLMTYRRNRGRGFVSSNDFEKNTEMGFVSTNNLQKTREEGGKKSTERENNERLQEKGRCQDSERIFLSFVMTSRKYVPSKTKKGKERSG